MPLSLASGNPRTLLFAVAGERRGPAENRGVATPEETRTPDPSVLG
jgi:hypothetical protein